MLPNLKAEMARNGIKNKDVALAAGVSERTVFSWINENGEPGVWQARSIKRAFFPGLDFDYLFDDVPKPA